MAEKKQKNNEVEPDISLLLSQIEAQKKEFVIREQENSFEIDLLTGELNQTRWSIIEATTIIRNLNNSFSFKLFHLWTRFQLQFIKGNKEERIGFFRWISNQLKKRPGDDKDYNPLRWILNALNSDIDGVPYGNELHQYIEVQRNLFSKAISLNTTSCNTKKIRKIIDEWPNDNIIVYPYNFNWEPLKMPQQILRAFSQKGWLCFFCQSSDVENDFYEVEPGLYIVSEIEFLRAIGDTHSIILITWMGSLAFVEKIRNKSIWYHMINHPSTSLYYGPYYRSLHNGYAVNAKIVSYAAKPLKVFFPSSKESIYLPNGVNNTDFIDKEISEPDDIKAILNTGHKIIGYYGILDEWIDYETIQFAAKSRPDYEFIFFSNPIVDVSKISTLPNVHILNPLPYTMISNYAKHFDIAVLPYLINDKTDCVSPINFYEYCAMGLPIVCSKMSEVISYENEFIACYKDAKEYTNLLDHFCQNVIKDKAHQDGPLIGLENSWGSRADKIERNLYPLYLVEKDYKKFDVIILSIIDYDYRHQRPQHFAERFAANGHRVFYFNVSFYQNNLVNEIADNLYIINIKNEQDSKDSSIYSIDWSDKPYELYKSFENILYRFAIRDAVVLVDYPNWINGAIFLREKFGFKILLDYMDDFTGFLNPTIDIVKKNCLELFQKCDHIAASSQFLYDIAASYNQNVSIVRNGTDFNFFAQASINKKPSNRKVVGYFGAIAHWFDFDLVCHLAKNLPACDIMLIGEISENQDMLSKHQNIKLLGERPYKDLPDYLSDFDVCIIPFETTTDLIKATNPVKFYEYLSAGKKVVATEIPELEPYRNEYVLMSNDKSEFLMHVKNCFDDKDCLKSKQERMAFGRQNDWDFRYQSIAQYCKEMTPKVSIIVLTYNSVQMNKCCINSVLANTAYPNYELIIVDNDSTDGTKDYLTELSHMNNPNVQIIFNNKNSGFAGGNNIGMKQAQGDYIILLNNDTIVTRGWITSLVKHLENNENMGLSGAVTNSTGNEARIDVKYSDMPELYQVANNYTWDHMGEIYSEEPNSLAFFAVCIKREIIEKCGYLDEGYGLGMFEDDDYCLSVKRAGYHICIAEDAFVHHEHEISFKMLDNDKKTELFNKNKERFNTKWNTEWKGHKYRTGVDWPNISPILLMDSRSCPRPRNNDIRD